MREADIDIICQKVPKRADGTMQALASRALEGEPLGPFEYFGTRSDDPNDIFPHQNRRELRGLRIFSTWLNYDGARSINSLNTYIRLSEGGYVKHHLINFESCFGSSMMTLQNPRANYEQMVGMKPSLKAGLSLGWWNRPGNTSPIRTIPLSVSSEAILLIPSNGRPSILIQPLFGCCPTIRCGP